MAAGPRQGKAAKHELIRRDRRRRRLALGLAGKRIGERGDQRAGPRGGGVVLAPVDRREQHAALLPLVHGNPQRALAVIGRHARKTAIDHAGPRRIVGMNLDERLRQMLAEPRAHAGAGHGVPLVADPAGVQPQRPSADVSVRNAGISGATKRALRSEAKNPPSEKTVAAAQCPPAHRPQHRRQRIERLVRQRLQRADIEIAAPWFSNADRAACSRKMSAADLKSNAAPKPSRFATSPTIHQSGLASPGAAGTRAAAKSAAPNWSPFRISRPRPAPAAAHARPS